MTAETVRRKLPDMVKIDLARDFHDTRISEHGELEISRYFRKDIYIALGEDLLELSKIQLAEEISTFDPNQRGQFGYVIRNLDADSQPALLVDDASAEIGEVSLKGLGDVIVMGRSRLTIGRTATPELRLSPTVSREHALFRLGNMAGNVHLMDLDSTNGTSVYMEHEETERFLNYERRYFVRGSIPPLTVEALHQRWTR